MYLTDYDLALTNHAILHWFGRCGLDLPARDMGPAVAVARPATAREAREIDHWCVARDEWTDRNILFADRVDIFYLVHEPLDIVFVVAADRQCPTVVTCIPYRAMRDHAVECRRRRKRRKRRAKQMRVKHRAARDLSSGRPPAEEVDLP